MPIPELIAPIWEVVNDMTVSTHAYWLLYMQLFGASQARIDTLNESASFFFYVVEGVLGADVQLALSKLADPATTGAGPKTRKSNATVQRLVNEIQKIELSHTNFLAELEDHRKRFMAACAPFKEYRDKVLAHIDLDTALRKAEKPQAATVAQIKNALTALSNLMNVIYNHYENSEIGYDLFVAGAGDGDALIGILRWGFAMTCCKERESYRGKTRRESCINQSVNPEENKRRDIFVTLFRDATKSATGGRAAQVASDHGHIVVRVEPGGARYRVLVLEMRRRAIV